MTTFGERLQKARVSRGLSTTGLAELADCSQPYITQMENNQRMPGRKLLQRLSEVLGVPIDLYLLNDNTDTLTSILPIDPKLSEWINTQEVLPVIEKLKEAHDEGITLDEINKAIEFIRNIKNYGV